MREPWLFLVSVFVYCSGMIHRRKEQEMRERKKERERERHWFCEDGGV